LQISVEEVNRIDTSAIYHKTTVAELQKLVPQIKWMVYFRELVSPLNITDQENVVSYSTPFFVELGKLLEVTNRRVVHNYIIWRLVMDLMPHMPPQYEKTRAEFRRVLLGVLVDRFVIFFAISKGLIYY
jgi:membrane metallo-endopeptidase-like protein 1